MEERNNEIDSVRALIDAAKRNLRRLPKTSPLWLEEFRKYTAACARLHLLDSEYDDLLSGKKPRGRTIKGMREEAEHARKMIERLSKKGLKNQEIAERLNADGVTTPSGGRWTRHKVSHYKNFKNFDNSDKR